jgi:predicted RNase H-like nuclease (RuvC/YqgF family)
MKKRAFIPIIAMFSIATIIGCKPATKEEQDAKENVQEAKEDVQEAKEDLAVARRQANAEEWQNFKDEVNVVIEKNDAKIAELKKEMKKTGKAANTEYDRKVDTLQKKNKELKLKLESYKNDADSDWQSFKREFNHDMDELGKAFNDLTVNNKN